MISPARILIGAPDQVAAAVAALVQKELARCGGCGTCTECRRISEERDWRIIVVRESGKEAIDRFLERCAYDAGGQTIYAIIYDADLLTASASARLLKDLEEPHAGYRFILTARSADRVLPTILSRCHKHVLSQTKTASSRIDWKRLIIHGGLPTLPESRTLDEHLSEEIDALMCALSDAYNSADDTQRGRIQELIVRVQKITEIQPLPGTAAQIIRALIALLAVSASRS